MATESGVADAATGALLDARVPGWAAQALARTAFVVNPVHDYLRSEHEEFLGPLDAASVLEKLQQLTPHTEGIDPAAIGQSLDAATAAVAFTVTTRYAIANHGETDFAARAAAHLETLARDEQYDVLIASAYLLSNHPRFSSVPG